MFSNPVHNIEQFVVGAGWHIADFGAGTGAYALALAKAVGAEGRVYAIDVQRGLLEKIKREAHAQSIDNIEIIRGDVEEYEGSELGDDSMDAAVVSNLLFQLEDKKGFVSEVKRTLRPEGRMLVVDWTESHGGLGPHPGHVFSKESARDLFESAGFIFEREINAGDYHYGLIFKKA